MKISPINNYQYNKNNNPSFKQIKPEFMFIDSYGFDKNINWAKTAVNIIDSGKQLIKSNTRFDDLIEYVSNRYHEYYKSISKFLGGHYFGEKRFAITSNILCGKYEPYRERAKKFLEKNTIKNSYEMKAFLPSQNKTVKLTEVKIQKLTKYAYSTSVEAPNTKVIEPVMNEVAAIYDSLKDEKDFNKITNSVAKIHWLVSQARPYMRGSAGIADMLSKMIFEAKDIQVSAYKRNVNPNLEAFVMPIEEYCKKYPEFFCEPLRKING